MGKWEVRRDRTTSLCILRTRGGSGGRRKLYFFIFYFICRESPRTGVFLIQITAPDLWREFLSSVILSKLGER